MASVPTEKQIQSKKFFYKRTDGHSILNSKLERMQAKSKLPPFDFDKHWQNYNKDGRVKVNKFLEKSFQDPRMMRQLISEMQLQGIDPDNEKLQHSKFDSEPVFKRQFHNSVRNSTF